MPNQNLYNFPQMLHNYTWGEKCVFLLPCTSIKTYLRKQPKLSSMEERIIALEQKQQEIIDAIMEINTNLAAVGLSTTESIKAIMEGFQSVNLAMHDVIQNFGMLEQRILAIESKLGAMPFMNN